MVTTDTKKIVEVASAFRLLSDPTRCKIVCLLIKNAEGMCVYELAEAVSVSHSAASHQLSKLEDKGVVECHRIGQQMCYKLLDTPFTKNLKQVISVFNQS